MEPKAGETIFISGGTGSLLSQGHSFGKEVWFKSNHQWKRKSEERVRKLGADIFIDYRKEDYSLVLKDVDYVLDTLGERELYKEFSILKKGGKLVSLRALLNRDFASRRGMPLIKRILFSATGSKYDRMAGEKGSITSSSFIKMEKDWKRFRPFSTRHTWKCPSMMFFGSKK